MSRFDDIINEREGSGKWSNEIARRVLNRKTVLVKKTRLVLSIAASIAVITCAGIFYQMNQTSTLKSSFDYVISETVSVHNENTFISKDVDNQIIQYCMNAE